MSDQSNVLSRVVRWGAVGLLLCVAIALYFRVGVHVEPLTGTSQRSAEANPAP
jgi:hypothetical protein